MPAQTKTVTLKGKHGAKGVAAAKAGAASNINYGFQRLPGGIENGIAKIKECYLAEYKKDTTQKQADGTSAAGEIYLRMSAVVVTPKTHVDRKGNEVVTAGSMTSVMIPILSQGLKWGEEVLDYDACVKRAQNEMRKVVGETVDASDFDSLVALIATAKPYTKFSTSYSKPQIDPKTGKDKIDPKTGKPYEPMVFENWNGSQGLEGWKPGQEAKTGAVVAEPTMPAGEFNEINNESMVQGEDGGDGGEGNEAASIPAPEAPGDHELDELVERAGKKDKSAQRKLSELAASAGMEHDAIENAASWQELADFIRSKSAGGGDDQDQGTETESEEPPKKGQPFFWKKRDKDGKLVRNNKNKVVKLELEVLTVNTKSETVTAKDLDSGTVLQGADKKAVNIPWDQMEDE